MSIFDILYPISFFFFFFFFFFFLHHHVLNSITLTFLILWSVSFSFFFIIYLKKKLCSVFKIKKKKIFNTTPRPHTPKEY